MGILGKTLDNIITSIDPEKGLKRMAARQKKDILNSGYGNYGASSYKNLWPDGCIAAGHPVRI